MNIKLHKIQITVSSFAIKALKNYNTPISILSVCLKDFLNNGFFLAKYIKWEILKISSGNHFAIIFRYWNDFNYCLTSP